MELLALITPTHALAVEGKENRANGRKLPRVPLKPVFRLRQQDVAEFARVGDGVEEALDVHSL